MFRGLFTAALAVFVTVSPAKAEHPSSFSQAKRIAAEVYAENPETFYCGCRFDAEDGIDAASCGYRARKQPKRGERLEWEHVVPAWEVGHQRQCWQQGGRANCRRNDPYFVVMTSDLHNLVPAVGELNGDRSNYRYGMMQDEPRAYGACDFEVDFKHRRAEPAADRQGDVARIYFYMRDRYGLRIGRQQDRLFQAWNKMDPVDARERARNVRIAAIQGNDNCYVSGDCKVERLPETPNETSEVLAEAGGFSCRSEIRYCTQMSSCEEATAYLTQCGLSRLDRDGDGTPCESLCR